MEIFIGNLPRYAGVSHLNRFFAGYGRVARFRILEKVLDSGEVVRFGYGVIEPDIAAINAIQCLNGTRLLGCALILRPYVFRSERERRNGGFARRLRRELRAGVERRIMGQLPPAYASWK